MNPIINPFTVSAEPMSISLDAIAIIALLIFAIITLALGLLILLKIKNLFSINKDIDRRWRDSRRWNEQQENIRRQAESIEDRIRNSSKSASLAANRSRQI